MRHAVLAALLLAIPARAAAATDLEPLRAGRSLHLVWSDPVSVLPCDFDAMASEVQAVFRAIGVDVAWRKGQAAVAADGEFDVVLLPTDPDGRSSHRGVMGRARREQDGRGVWIYVAQVRATLGLRGADGALSRLEEARLLPRALARVVAHELIHAVAPEEPHADSGVMQAHLRRPFLVGRNAPIDPRSAAAVRRALSPAPEETSILVGLAGSNR